MRSTIDSAGRLVLPKAMREAANLQGGTEVEIRIAGDHLEIEPVAADVLLTKKGGFVVATPRTPGGKLTSEEVERVRIHLYQDREDLSSAK